MLIPSVALIVLCVIHVISILSMEEERSMFRKKYETIKGKHTKHWALLARLIACYKTTKKTYGAAFEFRALLVAYFALPTVSSALLGVWTCATYRRAYDTYDVADEDNIKKQLHLLLSDPEIKCHSKEHNDLRWLAGFGFFSPLGGPIGTILVVWWFLRRGERSVEAETEEPEGRGAMEQREEQKDDSTDEKRIVNYHQAIARPGISGDDLVIQLQKRNDNRDLDGIRFIFSDYTPQCWWFEVWEVLRRVILTGALVLIPKLSTRLVVAVLVSFASIVYHLFHQRKSCQKSLKPFFVRLLLPLIFFPSCSHGPPRFEKLSLHWGVVKLFWHHHSCMRLHDVLYIFRCRVWNWKIGYCEHAWAEYMRPYSIDIIIDLDMVH